MARTRGDKIIETCVAVPVGNKRGWIMEKSILFIKVCSKDWVLSFWLEFWHTSSAIVFN